MFDSYIKEKNSDKTLTGGERDKENIKTSR
jgi:hypothetical protein